MDCDGKKQPGNTNLLSIFFSLEFTILRELSYFWHQRVKFLKCHKFKISCFELCFDPNFKGDSLEFIHLIIFELYFKNLNCGSFKKSINNLGKKYLVPAKRLLLWIYMYFTVYKIKKVFMTKFSKSFSRIGSKGRHKYRTPSGTISTKLAAFTNLIFISKIEPNSGTSDFSLEKWEKK